MKKVEYTFCMSQFKPAIAGLAVLIIAVVAWTGWHCSQERSVLSRNFSLAAATQPTAPPINVNDKMLHPYWGNCNKCHITRGAGRPVSKVMAGAPISINDKMPHKYWGNCLLCHKVVDGFQAGRNRQARAAAANRLTARSLGLEVQTVTAAMMRQFGLANEDGALVTSVTPGSIAAAAGLMKGDEIIRAGKTRVETINNLDAALNAAKPGKDLKVNIYRGKKQRNLFLRIPKGLATAAATAPMTQNQIETLAEQLGVPKTRQDVTRALEKQQQAATAANFNYGKVVVAASGPGIDYQVSERFGESPYLIVFDPALNSYKVFANPNANDATGRGVQTAQYAVDLGATGVIAGDFSQNALHSLSALRMTPFGSVVGSVRSALSAYAAGTLVPTDTAIRLTQPVLQVPPPGAATGKTVIIY